MLLRIEVDRGRPDPDAIERCAVILEGGGIGVVPTDTVYGIAALAADGAAVAKVLAIKRREAGKPLPAQASSLEHAGAVGDLDEPVASALAGRFWPGALTIVTGLRSGTRLAFLDGRTVGLRVPDSPFCRALIERAGYLVLPSANLPGAPAPVGPDAVAGEISGAVDFFVSAGPCPLGLESTVVDATAGGVVLREGAVSSAEVAGALEGVA